MTLTQAEKQQFQDSGYLGPYDLISPEDVDRISATAKRFPRHLLPFPKSTHILYPEMYKLATHPALLDRVKALLGEDVILWGSQIIYSYPVTKHRWHVDVEPKHFGGVTAWIPLENAFKTIRVIGRSDKFNISPQELEAQNGLDIRDDEAVMAEARKLDPEAEMVTPEIQRGQVVLWDGPTWHAATNPSKAVRLVLILQFSTPEPKIREPLDFKLPNTTFSDRQLPCLLLSGEDRFGVNNLMPAGDIGHKKLWRKFRRKNMFKFHGLKSFLQPLVWRLKGYEKFER